MLGVSWLEYVYSGGNALADDRNWLYEGVGRMLRYGNQTGLTVAGFGICKRWERRSQYHEAEQQRNYVDMKILRAELEPLYCDAPWQVLV